MHTLKITLLILAMLMIPVRGSVAAEPLVINSEVYAKMDVHERAIVFLEYVLDASQPGQHVYYFCSGSRHVLLFGPEQVYDMLMNSVEFYDSTIKGIEMKISRLCPDGI